MTTTLTQEQLTKIHSNIICIAFGIPEACTFPINELGYFKAIVDAAFMLQGCDIYCNQEELLNLTHKLDVFYKTLKNEANNGDFIANLYEHYNTQRWPNLPPELVTKRIPFFMLESIYAKSIRDKLDLSLSDVSLCIHVANFSGAKSFAAGFKKDYDMIDEWLQI